MIHKNLNPNLNLQEEADKEKIKNAIFLSTGKHILDTEAEEILNEYNNYLNRNYISIYTFACIQYANKFKHNPIPSTNNKKGSY